MPKFKRDVSSAEARTPVGVYDGPAVPDGTYAGILRSMKYRIASTGTEFWNTLVVLDAKNKQGQHAEYDGFQAWTKFYLDGSDFSRTKELGLYTAICGRGVVEVITDDNVQGDPVVTKVGGVNPIGARVYVELRTEEYQGEWRQAGFMIFPDLEGKKEAAAPTEAADEPEGEDELDVQAEEKPAPAKRTRKPPAKKLAAVPDPEPESEDVDYGAMTLPKVREAAEAVGISTKGVSKADLVRQLEAKAKGGDTAYGKSPQDIYNMSDQEVIDWVEQNTDYVGADFEGMERKDIVELLQEENIIGPF